MKSLNKLVGLQGQYEAVEARYGDIYELLLETQKERFKWKNKYKLAQVALQDAMTLQQQIQQR